MDPVTYRIAHMTQHFAPLSEEQRICAVSELMNFTRRQGESIDALLTRFMTLKFRAQTVGQAGVTMSWEAYSWLLLKACGPNDTQLIQLLQPYGGRYPGTEPAHQELTVALRRMGHILEGSTGNLGTALRSGMPNRSHFFTGQSWSQGGPTDPPGATFAALAAGTASVASGDGGPSSGRNDPWHTGGDPWQGQQAQRPQPPAPAQAGQQWSQYAPQNQGPAWQYYGDGGVANAIDYWTDTETESSQGDLPDYQGVDLNGSPQSVTEQM